MTEYEASRTLVKSPPELWAELSDPASLAGHLAEPFGEIRITRLEPETAVAWEGKRASGTVRIEPSGWGTRVTLTARAVQANPPEEEQPAPEPAPLPRPAPAPEPLPPAASEPSPAAAVEAPRRGLWARLFGRRGEKHEPGPEAEAPPAPPAPPLAAEAPRIASDTPPAPPPPESASAIDPDAVLVGVLDKLGAAHHRPFSRA